MIDDKNLTAQQIKDFDTHVDAAIEAVGKKYDADSVEAVMKKYDRESNVRIWSGAPAKFVKYLSALFSLYCIYITLFSTAMPEVRLNIFLGLILILGYLHYPIRKSHGGYIAPGLQDSISISLKLDTKPRINTIPFRKME